MNLFEKLNRLDDSLVESKRVINKKKLTESTEKTTIVEKGSEILKKIFQSLTAQVKSVNIKNGA